MNYFIDGIKKFADFTGRARRKEYWMFTLSYFIFSILLAVINVMLIDIGVFYIVITLGLIIPSISIAARRLHDTGRSGWWQLIALIPLIGSIIFIVFLVQDSEEDNIYGVNPKAGAGV